MLLTQLEQVGRTRQLWLEAHLLCLVDQPWRVPRLAEQQRQQVIATLPTPLLLGLLVTLADQHLGGHAYQFGIGA
ncbi:hypothetical protein D3C80_1792750 [compost metagenome]